MNNKSRIVFYLTLTLILLLSCFKTDATGNREEAEEIQETVTRAEAPVQNQNEPELTPIQQQMIDVGIQPALSPNQMINFETQLLDGTEISLDDYKGKVILLNLWATWCGPCRAEMPSMERFYNHYKDKPVFLAALNVREPKETVESYIKEGGYTFPVLMDELGVHSGIYSSGSIPTTYIINKEGLIIGRFVGAREWDDPELMELIDTLIQE